MAGERIGHRRFLNLARPWADISISENPKQHSKCTSVIDLGAGRPKAVQEAWGHGLILIGMLQSSFPQYT
jgi:hypothetical protein